MQQCFAVTLCGIQAGKVVVEKQGLYYHFSCRCRLKGDIIYRLVLTAGNQRINLGIPVPADNGFVLHTKLPVKKIGNGQMHFSLLPMQESLTSVFLPIIPEEPFAYISRLKESFLTMKNGQPGIRICKMQEQ